MARRPSRRAIQPTTTTWALIKAGWICGIIGTALSVLGAIIKIILSSLS
jgi:hypothetical protein